MDFTLITGASSGIGYELTRQFAKNGHNLILVARREKQLNHLALSLKSRYPIKVLSIPVDLCNENSAVSIHREVQRQSIHINYLINNAGFYVKGAFQDTFWEEEQRLIRLQCITHTELCKLFLPEILERGTGGILNICSTGSFVPGPGNAVYCAAKSFVLSFSEALAEEVKGSGVTICALCPGGTRTDFQDFSSRRDTILFPLLDPEEVAIKGYKSLMKGKRVVIPGFQNRMQVFLLRFLPRRLIARLAGLIVEN